MMQISGAATHGTTIDQVPKAHRQPEWLRKLSPIRDPRYSAGRVVIVSGRVDQNARLTRVVESAMKTCCVNPNPVEPIASKRPAV